MHFTTDRNALARSLASAGAAAAPPGAVWGSQLILTGLKAALSGDVLTVTGSNGDSLTIREMLTVAGAEDGAVVVDGKRALAAVKALKEGDVGVRLNEATGKLVIGSDDTEFRLSTIPTDGLVGFVEVSEPKGAAPTAFGSEALWEGLSQVLPPALSAAKAKQTSTMGGVQIDPGDNGIVALSSTDTFRMHIKEIEDTEGQLDNADSARIPAPAVKELLRLRDDHLDSDDDSLYAEIDAHRAAFSMLGTSTLITTLLTGAGADYKALAGDPGTAPVRIAADRAQVLDAIKTVSAVASSGTALTVRMLSNEIHLLKSDPEHGDGEVLVPAEISGKRHDRAISFNSTYLTDAVSACAGEELLIGAPEKDAAGRPAMLSSPDRPDFVAVLMPVVLPSDR